LQSGKKHPIVAEKFIAMRVRLSNHSLNSYGFWVLTSGILMERYNLNPVLLYMHQRGEVIGTVEDIKIEGEELTGELKFDEASELSKRAKKQFECGSLRMVSIGFNIIETSEDTSMLVPGQTRPTVTKCELFEVSVVDIGANPDAVRLYGKDGQLITLSDGGESPLPLLNNNNKKEQKMEFLKKVAQALGMPETATEAEILAKLASVNTESAELSALRQQVADMKQTAITAAVEKAISEKRLAADKKEQFIELGKKMGLDDLNAMLGAMQPFVKLGAQIHEGAGEKSQWNKLSDVPSDKLMELRENNRDEYKRLYRNEYGVECEL
jgi:HK97 family phage prohead protease